MASCLLPAKQPGLFASLPLIFITVSKSFLWLARSFTLCLVWESRHASPWLVSHQPCCCFSPWGRQCLLPMGLCPASRPWALLSGSKRGHWLVESLSHRLPSCHPSVKIDVTILRSQTSKSKCASVKLVATKSWFVPTPPHRSLLMTVQN